MLRPSHFLRTPFPYLGTDGQVQIGVSYSFSSIATYTVMILDDGCYFKRAGLPSVMLQTHRDIVRFFREELEHDQLQRNRAA